MLVKKMRIVQIQLKTIIVILPHLVPPSLLTAMEMVSAIVLGIVPAIAAGEIGELVLTAIQPDIVVVIVRFIR